MSAGQFSCAELAEVQLKADNMWADAAYKKDFIADVETLTAIRKEQTVRFPDLEVPSKDNTVKIAWIKDCDETIENCGTECTVGGAEAEAACDTHELTLCKKVGFTVDEKTFRTSIFSKEEVIAVQMMRKMKLLDEYLAETAVSRLESFKGVNAFTGGKGTVSGFETSISPAYWNANLFSYFALVMKKNKFRDAFMIHGDNLFEAAWNAEMNAANADGKDQAMKMKSLRSYWDVFNIDSVLSPDKSSFLIDRNAVAFASKAYWDNVPKDFGDNVGSKYRVESKNLPGVFYDVTYKVTCSGDDIKHNWSLQVKADIFRNPVGCNLNNTGVLKFLCE